MSVISTLSRSRRRIVVVTTAAAITAGSLGPVALASGDRSHHPAKHGARATEGAGPAARDAVAAMQRLVRGGIIEQRQANMVERQINTGSVDPQTLVGTGIVTERQMQAIANAIDQVKRSFGG
jgi:hypothetical protein